MTFCLSKGLSCPIGSMVVGSRDFIFRARRARKLVGGGMRQLGVLAACGLIALRDGPAGMIERLAEDHANTRRLAEALAEMPGVGSPGGVSQPAPGRLDPARARTNFVLFKVERDREAFLEELAARGVLMVGYPHGMIRAATHYGVTAADIEAAIKVVRATLDATSPRASGDSARPGPCRRPGTRRHGSAWRSHTEPEPAPANLEARARLGLETGRRAVGRPVETLVSDLKRPDGGLTRPPSEAGGPLDDRLYDLVEKRFQRLLDDHPSFATFMGIHDHDHELGDGTRDAVESETVAERAHLAAVEAIDPAGLSATGKFERELEIHNLRRSIFDTDVHRVWERRSTAMDSVGDAIFGIFVRDFAPLPERLDSIAARLEATPKHLEEHRTRAVRPQVRLWQEREIESAEEMPGLFDEMLAAGRTVLGEPELKRLERAVATATASVATYADWVHESLARAVDDWPLGHEAYDELIRLRAFDGLDADAILEIGERQLAENKARRVAAAREIDPTVDEPTVIDRIKSDHPATFEEALVAYRDVMLRARQHLIDRDIVTVPPGERIEVIATPDYLRNVIPFAAYFEPPKFDRRPSGIYVVTPSVGDDPNAMREHNRSSISNTSIHEAYPGHHLQLSVATLHPSLTRLLTDAPEFVEGWGMYSEQMMREEGFDDAANFRLNMHTDAIWRACRIILDVKMHRGEIGVEEAIRFMVEETSFEEPNARAEVYRYTYTPTYQLSYLLGKVLLLQLREDERRRLGPELQPEALPRHAAAQRQPADQLPSTSPGGRGPPGGARVIRDLVAAPPVACR